MGLFSLLSFLVVTSLGTLYPIYLSYKAIKNNDLQSLEVLLMFWIVIGIVNAFESTFGWLLHWIPFFYQFKTAFMLWLTLPQIQGSTYIYLTYLHPFLIEHELEIDTWLVEMKQKCRTTGSTYFYQLIDRLKHALLAAMLPPTDPPHPPNSHQDQRTTSQHNQIDGASAYTMNLIRQFGPTASAFFQPMQNRLPDSFYLGQVNYPRGLLQVPNSNLMPSSLSSQSSSSFQVQPDGYQIPDYDEAPPSLSSSTTRFRSRNSNEFSNRSNESSISRAPSSDSLRTTHRLDRQNSSPGSQHRLAYSDKNNKSTLGFSGYDEIGKDEASGSEHDWLLKKPSAPLRPSSGSSSSSLLNSRAGSRDKSPSNASKSAAGNDKVSQRNVSGSSSRWFPWSNGKTNPEVDGSRKDR